MRTFTQKPACCFAIMTRLTPVDAGEMLPEGKDMFPEQIREGKMNLSFKDESYFNMVVKLLSSETEVNSYVSKHVIYNRYILTMNCSIEQVQRTALAGNFSTLIESIEKLETWVLKNKPSTVQPQP